MPTNSPSLHDVVGKAARGRGGKTALVQDGETISYDQLLDRIENAAVRLQSLGIRPGDAFAVYGQNTLQHYYALYAASRIGAVIVPLNPHLTAAEVSYSFTHSEARLLFHDDALADVARSSIPADRLRLLASLGEPAGAVYADAAATVPDADFIISYSSGTTGTPKAVVLTQDSLFRVGESAAGMWGITEQDTTVMGLPLGYLYGINTASSPLLHRGGKIVVLRRFHPREVLDQFKAHRASIYMGVPTMYTMMMDYAAQRGLEYDLSTMRALICAGAPLPAETVSRFRSQFGLSLSNYYGLSESFPIASRHYGDPDTPPVDSVGKLAPGAAIRILRPDGTECATNEAGEGFVRGPAILKRYNKDSNLTAASLVDGFFRTGDLLLRDEKGFYYVTGRIKDIIIRGGHNISPAEVEHALVSHPAVQDAAVIGVPDPVFGEAPVAFVILRHGSVADAADIVQHVEASLSEFKVPRQIHILSEFPLGKTGKVDKRELQKLVS